MPEQITNYQCPNCTGPLGFDGASGKQQCGHCGASFDVAVIEQIYADLERAAAAAGAAQQWDLSMAGGSWSEQEAARIRSYSCPSCGAGILCDDTTAATSCPYCLNPTVVPGQFTGQLRPDYVIPFRLDKQAAKEALKKYYRKKKFLPKAFAAENNIDDVKGIYVPFWLFDGQADASVCYKATKVSNYTSGDYKVTDTDHYRVVREGSVAFEKVPVDGSSKMPDNHMDAVEPFDYRELKPFSTAYLPGFLADKYDVSAGECSQRANSRIIASTESAFAATAGGYTSLATEYSHMNLRQGAVKYALLPVWMLSTKWKGRDFLFAMNGQTGKLIGDLPIDKGKYWGWFLGIFLGLSSLLSLLFFVGGGTPWS